MFKFDNANMLRLVFLKNSKKAEFSSCFLFCKVLLINILHFYLYALYIFSRHVKPNAINIVHLQWSC